MKSRSDMKKTGIIRILLLTASLCLSGCQPQPAAPQEAPETQQSSSLLPAEPENEEESSQTTSGQETDGVFTERDLAGTWDETEAVPIVLSGRTAEAGGAGVTTADGLVQISQEGVYVLTGSFDGQIQVSVDKQDKVQLVLSGVSLSCASGPAIWVQQADKVFITLAEGTENTVTDGASYILEDGEDEPDGAIFSKEDLTINGSGSLTVTALYQDGIVSKDDLKICGGTLDVTAVDDGLRGKDSVSICGGTITVAAGSDGIKSTNTEEEDRGNVLVTGGKITVCAGDDGIHAARTLAVEDGQITVSESYEGLEGRQVYIRGGEISVTADDDGVNAAGGSDSAGMRPQDPFAGDADIILSVEGGSLYVNAEGDGLDSNGYLYVTGGAVWISGPTNSGNGALDYGLTAEISGGVLAAAGSYGMSGGFSETSVQASAEIVFSSAQPGGTRISLKDAAGHTVIEYTPDKQFQHIVLSSSELTVGETYTLFRGDTALAEFALESIVTCVDDQGNVSAGGGMMDGKMHGGLMGGGKPGKP